MKGRIYMSEKELDRVEVFKRVSDNRMKQSKAANILGLRIGQIKKRLKSSLLEVERFSCGKGLAKCLAALCEIARSIRP
jgi:hypothetical protein